MSDAMSSVVSAYEQQVVRQLEIEYRKADAFKREVEVREDDLRTYPERCRAQRHHDVLCLVLKELVVRTANQAPLTTFDELVDMARKAADLAYPPPKAEP